MFERYGTGLVNDLANIAVLTNDQVAAFDFEQISDERWLPLATLIDRDFADGKFTVLDVGGGNGAFADRVLSAYPDSLGVVLDNSDLLLRRNKPNSRKTLIHESVAELGTMGRHFDLVCAHWVLHHMVGSSYARTRANQAAVVESLAGTLTDRGRICVFENNYAGLLGPDIPGYLIYQLTASRVLAPITRRFGANTAGVGVCFQSRRQWEQKFRSAGLQLTDYAEPDSWQWPIRWYWRVAVNLKDVRAAMYWLKSAA